MNREPSRARLAAAALAVALALAACSRTGTTATPSTVHDETLFLLNLEPPRVSLDGAAELDLRRPGSARAGMRASAIGFEVRRVLQQARGSEVRFRSVLRENGWLHFEVGFSAPGPEESDGRPFALEVVALDPSGEEALVWSGALEPPRAADEFRWTKIERALPFPAGDLVLRCAGPSEPKVAPGAPGWANPRIVVPDAPIARVHPARRSVVVFLIDTLRADHVGPNGSEKGTTPVLDSIAQESLVFTQASSAAPWTKASVGSLMTSRFPSMHGAESYQDRLRESEVTLAAVLDRAGFDTCSVGFNTWVFNPKFNLGLGFEEVLEVFDQSREGGAPADAVIAEAIDWIARRDERPFFLYVHAIDPHGPYVPADEERARFVPPYAGTISGRLEGPDTHLGKRRAEVSDEDLRHVVALSDAEIAYTDRMLGRLVEYLRAAGLWEETLLVVTADHGEEFLDHGNWSHGGSLYQEQLHVPLVVKPPASAGLAPGTRSEPVSLLDVAPTVCELAGAPWEGTPFLGRSLLPLASDPDRWREAPILAEVHKEGMHAISVRSGELKYIAVLEPTPREELYDLTRDPAESENLIRSIDAQRLEALRSLVEAHRSRVQTEGLFVEILGDGREAHVTVRIESETEAPDYNLLEGEREGDEHWRSPSGKDGIQAISARLGLGAEDRRDGVVLRSPPDEPLVVTLTQDGKPLDPRRILIGADMTAARAARSTISADDPRLLVPAVPAWDGRAGIWCRVFRVVPPEVELEQSEIDALEALGYVGD